jgi:hypothetical protein
MQRGGLRHIIGQLERLGRGDYLYGSRHCSFARSGDSYGHFRSGYDQERCDDNYHHRGSGWNYGDGESDGGIGANGNDTQYQRDSTKRRAE